MKKIIIISLIALLSVQLKAQLNWNGQVSAFTNFSPDNQYSLFLGGRYIPEINYIHSLDSGKSFDILASVDLNSSILSDPFQGQIYNGALNPYRFWARYSGQNYQVRIGLQKIDFGVSTLLRPLQWFNQIDPRDPLALTNGVYGIMGKYYFKNNANIWAWGLYGNEKRRGFDAIATNDKIPEFGGRLQLPILTGEIGLTYHHRKADASNFINESIYQEIAENRFALDLKLDWIVGFWVESTYIHKAENLGPLTNQNLINIGSDYTFGLGNGLTIIAENLLYGSSEEAFSSDYSNITAMSLNYPFGFFDSISSLTYYNWDTNSTTFFVNYQHQFNKIIGYLMAYYNPSDFQGIQQNELVNNFSGPGVRLMLVYNH
ncbi:hypothetical protein QYS48_30780 [Marivirga arenosa]|uniref:Uncharacterized protein n=1 Tax=Marivirga arenosa TaxID=3059076 RepID=A0AA51NBI3_9BACT|nr:hypothetical protein [Marivirga sp. ABR2-2]WMN08026.1 hypothetical protein QYS48_30780 [Marivirga sp. ABR2-2]